MVDRLILGFLKNQYFIFRGRGGCSLHTVYHYDKVDL